MKLKHIVVVLKKEMKDMVRDKRTIITTILIPMILIPVLYYFMGSSSEQLDKDITENLSIAIKAENNKTQIEEYFKNEVFAGKENIVIANYSDPIQSLKDGDTRIVLEVDSDYLSKLQKNIPVDIKMTYDSSKMTSSGSIQMITQMINDYNQKVITTRISALGIDTNILQPTAIQTTDVAPEESQNNMMLSMILPMLLSILLVTAGAPAAIDLIVGEREKKTFEPLLTTKANRFSILIGKYLAVSAFSLISIIASLVGVVIGMKMSPGLFGENVGFGLNMPAYTIVIAALTIVLFGLICSAVQILLSAFAKTIKEGQTYTSFLTFAIMIPAYATMFMQAGDIQMYMGFIPALNIIALIKMVLAGMVDYTYLLITFGSSIVYFIAIMLVTLRLFKKESIVIR